MLERFKAWLKSRSATTPCELWAGDTLRVYVDACDGTRQAFEFEVRRGYKTKAEALEVAKKLVHATYVQERDYI